jgi:hypothetical protein
MSRRKGEMLSQNPLREDELLAETLFQPLAELKALPAPQKSAKPKPAHYKICCISLYTEDIARLEALVSELKRRGHTKASKSQVIRFALAGVDIRKMPKGY